MWTEAGNAERFSWSGSVRQERGIADVVDSGPLKEGGCESEGSRRGSSLLCNIKHDSTGIWQCSVHGDAIRLKQEHAVSLTPNH